jgi:hypothetical protein
MTEMDYAQKGGLHTAWHTAEMCRCRECYCCKVFMRAPKEAPPYETGPALDAWVAKYMGETK